MCGIFAIINNSHIMYLKQLQEAINIGRARGPENTNSIALQDVEFIHRLLIILMMVQCNLLLLAVTLSVGEIYNTENISNHPDVKPQTHSDCEIIIHMYKKYGMTRTLKCRWSFRILL